MTKDMNELVDQYNSLWNEPDARERRRLIEALWQADGVHFTTTRTFKGYEALEARASEAYGNWVADKGFRFRVAGVPLGHHGVVKFTWEMYDPRNDTVTALGSDVLSLDEQGRIISDHQFNEPLDSARARS